MLFRSESDLQTYEVNGDVVLSIHVPKARREDKPIYLNDDIFGKTFRRNGEGDYRCTREEVLAMIRDQTEETPDMRILENFGMDVLNKETVHAYRQRHNAARPTHVWGNLDDDAYLERIGAAKISDNDGKYHPTAAGLLMCLERSIRYSMSILNTFLIIERCLTLQSDGRTEFNLNRVTGRVISLTSSFVYILRSPETLRFRSRQMD